MANEEEANLARKHYQTDLLRRGAHAIGIENGKRHGKKGWVVVAHILQDAKVDLPSTISIARKNNTNVAVPLVVTRSQPFKPE